MNLNARAAQLCDRLADQAAVLRCQVRRAVSGGRLIDTGIEVAGGLEAGRLLAEICLAGLGQVEFAAASPDVGDGPAVSVRTDQPVAACMASQYAGWRIALGKFFAMGSGPMRAAAGNEDVFERIGNRESADVAVGVLETRQFPPDEVFDSLARDCHVEPAKLTLVVAPTASQAGTVQIVARSIETALHKLLELGFDLGRVESGWGVAPLPPVAANDLAAIGRTNDAILYGAKVTLWVRGDDDSLADVGPRVPSSASPDFGEPFASIFERYDRNFYEIDPRLFSPAMVTLVNLDSGRSHRFGQPRRDILERSFQS
jgi:methenyltetrahydromethanopterin cyclohydrolase